MNKALIWGGLVAACVAGAAQAQTANAASADPAAVRDLVLQDVRQQGIDKAPEVQQALRLAQEAVLIRAWERKVVAGQSVTPAMKQAIYQDLKAVLGNWEYKVLQLQLEDEKVAQALASRMKEAADWRQLDPKQMVPPEARLTVNRTDWINLSAIASEFQPQVRAMKAGEFTAQPLRTKAGWQVIGVLETRPFVIPSADRLDKDLVRLAERSIIEQRLAELRQRTLSK